MDLLSIGLLSLATHRLVSIWLAPLGILTPIREYLAQYNSFIKFGVNCGLCVSTWAAAFVIGLWFIPIIGYWVVLALAIATLSSVVNGLTMGT